MADLYAKLQAGGRHKALTQIRDTDRKIASIYETAADELARLAGKQKTGSLTERWQKDMSESLADRMGQLNRGLVSAVRGASKTAAGLPGTASADWLSAALKRATGETGGNAFRSVLTRTSDEALRAVVNGQAYLDANSLSKRIWKINGGARDGMNEILRQGIAQKKSAYQVAKELEAFVKPKARETMDWRKVYPDLPQWLDESWTTVETHAQTVARTSINHAYHIAMKEAAADNPFASAIHWELSPSHYARQVLPYGADVCDEYADHNEGLGRGNWPIRGVPMPHPKCLCSQWAVVPESLDACAGRLKNWLDGNADTELDGAFGTWKTAVQYGGNVAAADTTAAQRRNGMMETIVSQKWAQKLSVTDREAMTQAFLNASEDELGYWAHNGDKLIILTELPDNQYTTFSKKIKELHDGL